MPMGYCYKPLKGFLIGITDAGKKKLKVCSSFTDHIEFQDGRWSEKFSPTARPESRAIKKKFIEIPCGQCIGCRLQRSREWANRLMAEAGYHEESWFVTLTYDDEHLPKVQCSIDETGEILELATLQKRDMQLFVKRLRKAIEPEKIRFYGCGEYGGQTFRPHYHLLLFGLHLEDLVFYKRSYVNNQVITYYNSPLLSKVWSKGHVVIGKVTWETCAYCARYVTKKIKDSKEGDVKNVIEPEFSLMSRRPGIGYNFYVDHVQNMEQDDKFIFMSTPEGGLKFARPRYYQKLDMADDNSADPVDMLSILEQSLLDEFDSLCYDYARNRSVIEKEQLSYGDYLVTQELYKKEQVKSLKRKEI